MTGARPGIPLGVRNAWLPLFAFAAAGAPAHAADRVFWNGFEPAITTPAETWTWVPLDNALCGDGSSTGIGFNPTSASDRLLIYLEGGGACWDYATCYFLKTAAYFNSGFGAADFEAAAADTQGLAEPGGFFDRSAASNPFRDYSYVYVPYCTGDVHAGDNTVMISGHLAHFAGHRNVAAILERLAVTFPTVGRVVIAGSSAGGIGATLNWWQTAQAFPGVRVDMINDSGAVIPEDVLPDPNTEESAQRAAWNLAATLPPGCAACASAFDVIIGYYANAFPDSRGALLSYEQDAVLPFFYGISTSAFTTGLFELETRQFDPTANLRYFDAAASGHVLWNSPTLMTGSTSLQQFVTKMVSDDPGWTSAAP